MNMSFPVFPICLPSSLPPSLPPSLGPYLEKEGRELLAGGEAPLKGRGGKGGINGKGERGGVRPLLMCQGGRSTKGGGQLGHGVRHLGKKRGRKEREDGRWGGRARNREEGREGRRRLETGYYCND